MLLSERVHCRAAEAGATTRAIMRISPTTFSPITIASTMVASSSSTSGER